MGRQANLRRRERVRDQCRGLSRPRARRERHAAPQGVSKLCDTDLTHKPRRQPPIHIATHPRTEQSPANACREARVSAVFDGENGGGVCKNRPARW